MMERFRVIQPETAILKLRTASTCVGVRVSVGLWEPQNPWRLHALPKDFGT